LYEIVKTKTRKHGPYIKWAGTSFSHPFTHPISLVNGLRCRASEHLKYVKQFS